LSLDSVYQANFGSLKQFQLRSRKSPGRIVHKVFSMTKVLFVDARIAEQKPKKVNAYASKTEYL